MTDPLADLYRRCELCNAQLPDDAREVACASCDVDVFVCAACNPSRTLYVCGFCTRATSLDEPTDADFVELDDSESDALMNFWR